MNNRESILRRAALVSKIARIERRPLAASPTHVALGHAAIDAALGGGLARGRLHEIFATDADDGSSAAGFAAMVARRLGGGIVWLRQADAQQRGGTLHAHGLAAIGIDPRLLILIVPPDARALLHAAAEVVRCAEVGVAVIELWRTPRLLDLTASRRLALAAESSGVTALMLRVDAEAAPSAAQTRWLVRAAASVPLAAGAPGYPALDIGLVRQRGRPAGGDWQVEWDRDRAMFRDRDADGRGAAASGAVLSVPGRRPVARVA